MGNNYRVGDRVVILHQQYASQPPADAKQVVADRNGERYQYLTERSATIRRLLSENRLEIEDQFGKREVLDSRDPRVRPSGMTERFLLTFFRWKNSQTPVDS